MNSDNDFPAPPEPADLAKLSMEAEELAEATDDQMITTPRTLRRADSLRQKMAARRIQRTWKHFYQELEEKKSDDPHYATLPSTKPLVGLITSLPLQKNRLKRQQG